jgi:hypothetical protein
MKNQMDSTFLKYASGILGDTNFGLSSKEIDTYLGKYSVKYNNSDARKSIAILASKRDKLFQGISRFTASEQYEIIDELCSLPQFDENDQILELKRLLQETQSMYAPQSIQNLPLVQETKHWLADHTDALASYESAMKKFDSGVYERNAMDDMRLAFELLVKDLLANDKSLENQIKIIGAKLEDAGTSKEIRLMVTQIISYYTRYQNEYVKHNDRVNQNEIEYIFDLTSVLMKFLMKTL